MFLLLKSYKSGDGKCVIDVPYASVTGCLFVTGSLTVASGNISTLTGGSIAYNSGAVATLTSSLVRLVTTSSLTGSVTGVNTIYVDSVDNLLKSLNSLGKTVTYAPANTKGDFAVHTGVTQDRLPVGSNTSVLVADSTQQMGVKWEIPPPGTSWGQDSLALSGALSVSGATTLQNASAGTISAAYLAATHAVATSATITSLYAGASTLGATSATTFNAGATSVAALSAAATDVSSLSVSGAASIGGACTAGATSVSDFTATGAATLASVTAGTAVVTSITATSATITTLNAGVSKLAATSVTTLRAGASVVAALSAAAVDCSTLDVSGAANIGGAFTVAAATSLAALTASGQTTLAGVTAGSAAVTSLTATSATITTLFAGASNLGASQIATINAGATQVAGLSAAAVDCTTLGVSGAATVGGALNVTGNLTKGSGSFVIDHPEEAKRAAGFKLKHCFVESPTRGDNLYRFRVQTEACCATIDLPSYFSYLNENVQGWVSGVNVLGYGICTISEDSKTAMIEVSADGVYNILIIGTRTDYLARQHFEGAGGVEFVP